MANLKRNKILLSDDERKYLYLYFKSKDISINFKKKTIKEKVLEKLKGIFRVG